MKLSALKAGMVVYDVHKTKMGNTKVNTVGIWSVLIVSVDEYTGSCVASWNGNKEKVFYTREIEKWRKNKPKLIPTAMGGYRLATREEAQAKTLRVMRFRSQRILEGA